MTARLRAAGHQAVPASRGGARRLDWSEPSGWDDAVVGVQAVYLAYAPDLAVPGSGETLAAFTGRAAAAGARRVVLLSGRGEPGAQAAEQAVAAAADAGGVDWTVLRCSWFAQNFTEGAFAPAMAAGELALPVAGVREPFIDADDIADVAVAALLGDGHAGRVHELTGPRSLTFAEAVAAVAAATGRPARFRTEPVEEHLAGLAAAGVPDDVRELMRHLFTEVLDGRNSAATDGVRRVLGREPADVAAHVHRAASVPA
ncbi:NAD(P)H-binding protein [Modestobacter sp. SYSU DS0290]